ncbi:hypothetical protein [Campylobacter devanensis]|nr:MULTISPECIES: hypothetical protein [unclassified Campylobacter]
MHHYEGVKRLRQSRIKVFKFDLNLNFEIATLLPLPKAHNERQI